jgi:hypothetical protein
MKEGRKKRKEGYLPRSRKEGNKRKEGRTEGDEGRKEGRKERRDRGI